MFDLASAPRVRDRAISLGEDGLSPRQAGQQLGVISSTVSRWYRQARDAGHDIPYFSPRRGPARPVVRIDAALADALRPAALARGVAVEVLARQLLDAVLRDGLIEAVLDAG